MLSIDDLRLQRGQGSAAYTVQLPSLRLARGQIMAVVGGSGCGKSTLLEGIGLLLAPAHVSAYTLGATDVAALLAQGKDGALARLRAASIGFVLQTGGLLPFLSVRENILLPRRLLGLPVEGAHVDEAIRALGLNPLLSKRPAQLSIGERQRVAVVRALSHEPDILLADEPTSALDPENAHRLFQMFKDLAMQRNIATLVVSHDWDLVEKFDLPCLRPQLKLGASVFVQEGG